MLAIASFFAFTALVAIISWLKTRGSDQDHAAGYFLAGRSLPWYVVTGSLMLTNLSTEQLVGLNGGAYLNGAVVMAWEVVAAVALVIMALYFLPRYWSRGITTVPQFLEKRFDRATRQILGTIFLLSLAGIFLPFVLYSGALAMNGLFGIPELLGVSPETAIWIMVWSIGIAGALYSIFGGLKAVAVSDSLNGIGLLFGGLLIPFLGLVALGEGSLADGWTRILERQAANLDPVGSDSSAIPVGTLFTGMLLLNVFYWCTNQAIVQRVFGAKSLAEGQKGVLGAAFLKLLGPLYLVLPGIIALELFGPDLENGDLAYPLLVEKVLPTYLVGLFGAVMFGAILSSFNSVLHSTATLFGLDIYKGLFKPEATDRETVVAGKLFGTGLAVGSMTLAPFIAAAPDGLFSLMKQVNAIFNIPVLAVIVIGMTTRSVPAWAAKTALFLGMAVYITFNWGMGGTLFGWQIHWLHFAGLNFAFLCGLMLAAGKLYGREPVNEDSERPEQGWRLTRVAAISATLGAVALYIGLHFVGS